MSTRIKWEEGSSIAKEVPKEDDTIDMSSEMSKMSFELTMFSKIIKV